MFFGNISPIIEQLCYNTIIAREKVWLRER
jgi:hypothetical protein